MADTLPSETVTPEAPSNAPGISSVPALDNTTSAELEAARKEIEQARMRANQLQNQLAEKETAEAAAKQKQLEEKEEFKTLYEQTNAKLNEFLEGQASTERQNQLKSATEDVFKDYSADAVELAKTAGLSLSDDSDAARAVLKEKLDTFQAKVGTPTSRPGASNPRNLPPQVVERQTLTQRNADGVSPMALAGAKGDDSVVKNYIRSISAIERMKEIARNGN